MAVAVAVVDRASRIYIAVNHLQAHTSFAFFFFPIALLRPCGTAAWYPASYPLPFLPVYRTVSYRIVSYPAAQLLTDPLE